MVKFKEILKKLDLDLNFDDAILELDLPVDTIFDRCTYYPEDEFNFAYYNCKSSIDNSWTLKIYSDKNNEDDVVLDLHNWSRKNPFGITYLYNGKSFEQFLPDF